MFKEDWQYAHALAKVLFYLTRVLANESDPRDRLLLLVQPLEIKPRIAAQLIAHPVAFSAGQR